MRTLKVAVPLVAIAAMLLAGCSDPDSTTKTSVSGDSQSQSEGAASFDPAALQPVPDIVAMVPESLANTGILRNGASAAYPPAEYFDTDGQTPIGFDIDTVKALAAVMGLKGETSHAEFPTIIPGLGTKFDIGMSSFTITAKRLEQVNMVSYAEVGSAYAVSAGNPTGFDPADPCGTTIGVQNGTYQLDYAKQLSDKCVKDGKKAITVMPHDLQSDVTTKVVGGQYDATFADSTVVGFVIANSAGKLEQIGEVIDSAPQGIAIAKDDLQLTAAIQAAMQYLMDKGYLKQIMAAYGADAAALSTATINPQVD